jgi:hypothetical protein
VCGCGCWCGIDWFLFPLKRELVADVNWVDDDCEYDEISVLRI